MCKIALLFLLFIFKFISISSGQEIFQTKSKKNFTNGPKLFLSRENPMYSQNKTEIKPTDLDDDVYTRKILGLNTNQNRYFSRTPDAAIVPINRPIQSKESPFYKLLTSINPDLQKTSYHEHEQRMSNMPNHKLVPKKNNLVILENGTVILGGCNIQNNNKGFNLPEISSYKVKMIKVNNDQPIVQQISTIRFNGATVTPEFIQNYFNEKIKNTDDEFKTSATKFINKKQRINMDGYGLIDERSSFDTDPKMSKLSILRKRGIRQKNATTTV